MTTMRWRWMTVLLIGLVQLGCPDSDDEPDGEIAGDGMVDDMHAADGDPPDMPVEDGDVPDMPVGGTDGGMSDAGPDAMIDDPCDGVRCDAGERCDPDVGECVVVGEPGAGAPSSGCDADADCDAGTCNLDVPGGFCQAECDPNGWCGSVDLLCAQGQGTADMPASVCLDECDSSGCRDGWVCAPDAGGSVCVPPCTAGGCGPTSYCDAASGLCAPFAGPAIAEGEACNSQDDRCAAGLACLPDDETGRGACRALCEPQALPCADDAFCAVVIDAENGAPAVGICLPDDGCDPLNPEEACGPDSACIAAPPATLCVGTGAQEPGQPCGDDRLCVPGLICQYGACKQPCADAAACGDNEECVDFEDRVGRPFGFCHQVCSPLEPRSCGRAGECALVDMAGDDLIGRCGEPRDAPLAEGEPCTPDATYHGDCAAANVCDAQAALRPTCRLMCTAETVDRCRGQVCAMDVFDDPFTELGLCIGGCNVIGGQPNCPGVVPMKCGFTGLLGVDVEGREVLVGECVPNIGQGQVETGQPCDIDEVRGTNNCPNGHICASVGRGFPAECVQLCNAPPPGRNPCAVDGYECVTGLFGDSALYGACLP